MKGTKDLRVHEVKVRLTEEEWNTLLQASAITGVPRASVIRSVWKQAVERGVREFFLDGNSKHTAA